MSNENYIVIQGWFVNELKLQGNNLLTFALIYGFSQDGSSEFTGSINYICDSLNCSRPTASKALNELCELNYIIKRQVEINNVTFNRYKVNLEVVKKFFTGSKETLQGGSKDSLWGGSKDSLHNNTNLDNSNLDNTNNIYTSKKISKKVEQEKLVFGEHQNVFLTLEEAEKIKLQRGGAEFDAIVDKLSNYKIASGKKYKSDYGAINTWVIESVKTNQNKQSNGQVSDNKPKPKSNPHLKPGWSTITGDEWFMRPIRVPRNDGESN